MRPLVAVMARPESGGLGLRVDADNVVSKIISGGAAAVDGRLRLGDRILAVNGQSLKGKKLVDVMASLQPGAKRGSPPASCRAPSRPRRARSDGAAAARAAAAGAAAAAA